MIPERRRTHLKIIIRHLSTDAGSPQTAKTKMTTFADNFWVSNRFEEKELVTVQCERRLPFTDNGCTCLRGRFPVMKGRIRSPVRDANTCRYKCQSGGVTPITTWRGIITHRLVQALSSNWKALGNVSVYVLDYSSF